MDNNVNNSENTTEEVNHFETGTELQSISLNDKIQEEVNVQLQNQKEARKFGVKYRKALIIIGLLILVLVAILCYGYFFRKGPENIYYDMIDYVRDYASDYLTEASKDLKGPKRISNKITFNLSTNNEEFKSYEDAINKFSISTVSEIDKNNKKISSKVNVDYDTEALINVEALIKDNEAYVKLNNLFDKIIKVSNEESDLSSLWQEEDIEDYQTILTEITKIIKNNLKSTYFTKTSEKLYKNGKDIDTVKYVMRLTNNDIHTLELGVLNDIKGNDKLISVIANLLEIDKDAIVNQIDEMIEYMDTEDTTNEEAIKITTYLNKKTRTIEKIVLGDDTEILVDKTKDGYELKLALTDTDNLVVNINEKDKTLKISYLDNFIEINSANKNQSIKVGFDMDGITIEASVNIVTTEENITEVEEMDTTGSVNIDDLTESEKEGIASKFMEIEIVKELLQMWGVEDLISESKYNEFTTTIDDAINSASNVMSLITLNVFKVEEGADFRRSQNGNETSYCMTLKTIHEQGWGAGYGYPEGYEGYVIVRSKDGNYDYDIKIHNDKLYYNGGRLCSEDNNCVNAIEEYNPNIHSGFTCDTWTDN